MSTRDRREARARAAERGQALVEFSLGFLVFAVLVVGIFDLGRGIYTYNGLSQAARELARVTSVHPGVTLGTSQRTLDVVAVQKSLVPGMGDPVFACVDYDGSAVTGTCTTGHSVRVTVSAAFTPVAFLGFGGTFNLSSTSSMQLP